MNQQPDPSAVGMTELTADIVSAYVGNNSVHVSDLPSVIVSIHSALQNLGQPQQPAKERPAPPIPIKKTVTPDYLISLEDGKRYKSLKRHLAGRGLTPDQSREKWGLPGDYPMMAPNSAAKRSEIALASGLGRKREEAPPVPPKRGRRKGA